MGLFNLFKRKASEPPPVRDDGGVFGGRGVAGVPVNERTAMGLAAHFACVRLISTTLASLSVHVYERTAQGRSRCEQHPVSALLNCQPNPDMVAFLFLEGMQAQVCNWGKAFAEIVFDRAGNPSELWPFAPGACVARRREKDQRIEYYLPKTGTILPAWKVLHIPGLSFDGLNSFSPVQLHRQTFGFHMATKEFGNLFFGQGTNPGGFFQMPGKFANEESVERFKNRVREMYSGLQNSFRAMVLEEGMTFNRIAMPLQDLQYIEIMKFSSAQMAQIHGVPPHLIGDLERATFSNIEEQGIEAVTYLFRPWAVRWEQALAARLFTPEDRRRFYIRFELDSLLRGNIKTRYEAYQKGVLTGFLNRDEVREKEDLNPIPGGAGQVYLEPLNMKPAGYDGAASEETEGEQT